MAAIVCKIALIEKHPNANRLDLVTVTWKGICSRTDCQRYPDHLPEPVTLVTGAHYRERQRGIYITPGTTLPGYLAEDLWLVGRGSSNKWHQVESKIMRGIESPGLFCGAVYQKVRDDPRSVERFTRLKEAGGVQENDEWIKWPYFRDHWKDGEDVSAYLGIR